MFSPGKADSTQVNNVIQEEYTDTLTEAYSPADTVVTMLKNIQSRVTDTQQERMEMVNRRTQSLRLSGLKLSQKVNQLLSTIEEEEQALAQNKHIQEEYIRQSSIRTVAGIAIVAVVLAIFFLVLIWRDITRSNHYRRELEKAKRRAEDLLAAREKLMLTITHDIKAPRGFHLGLYRPAGADHYRRTPAFLSEQYAEFSQSPAQPGQIPAGLPPAGCT